MVEVPDGLLARAQGSTSEGTTATIRRALELVAVGRAYDDLRALRGKLQLSIDLERLPEDG